MDGLLYFCPLCGVEATVPEEYVGQTVQCPHCAELFVASAPVETASDEETADQPADSDSDSVAPRNPAEEEPIPSSQEKYRDAETIRQILTLLSKTTDSGEVAVSDDSGSYDPSILLSSLEPEVLDAQIVGRGSDDKCDTFMVQTKGFFFSKERTFRVTWSPNRRGWACDSSWARTLHYFVPLSEIAAPPDGAYGRLVSLCKKVFCVSEQPLHRREGAARCTICLERRGKMIGYDAPQKPKKKAHRITLTKEQTETPAGRSLLQLISQLANDRKLDTSELQEFRTSLNGVELQDLTATTWLKDTLDTVLADGSVTREEYYAVIASILRVLPGPIRDDWERRMRSGDRPVTDRQIDYIKGLGGEVTEGMTVNQARNRISYLLRVQKPDEDRL